VIAKNSINYIALYLACKRTNNIIVPINHKLPLQAQEELIDSIGVSEIFRDDQLENIELTDGDINYSCDNISTCMLLFTSGSSGLPKAVVITNSNRQNSVRNTRKAYRYAEKNPRILATPLCHINAFNTVEMVLSVGGKLLVLPEFDAYEYIKRVVVHRVGGLLLIPSILAKILEHPEINKHDFGFVNVVVTSTSTLTENLYNKAKSVFYNAKIQTRYGLTEFGNVFGEPPDGLVEPPLTCGYPLSEVEYKLVDGVLHLRGKSASSGYYQSDQTKIVDGWLNTGDLFRVDENGFYFHMGRADDMYKVGGEQVYPAEIETLLSSLPGVEECCVVMIEDEVKGHKPYAFCTGTIDERELKQAMAQTLPMFKVPRNIWHIESMPLMGVGKPDKKFLIEKAKGLL
jgi:acyl-CoA synthetase (AMP-forming)/AMP-acid ligase II